MIHYLVPADQQSGIREYLERWGRGVAGRMRIVPYEGLPDATRLETGIYVLSALEQLGPALRQLVVALHRTLHATEGFRFLNHPIRTLGRFELMTELHRLGLNDFRAVRAGDDLGGLRYPVFLRSERSHDGAVSPLVGSRREVEAAIGRAIARGRRLAELLVVEFCPTADAQGRYRKYAAYVVGDRIVPRHLAHGPRWMVKLDDSDYPAAMIEEERDYVARNPHEAELATIRDVAGVGYGRIDYSIGEGGIQTWEINLNPTIGTPWDPADERLVRIERDRRPVHELFYSAFQAAWEAVDVVPDGRPPVPIDVDPSTLRAATAEAHRPRSRRVDFVRWLEPLRPVLDRVPTPVIAWAGRLARRRGSADQSAPSPPSGP